METSAVIYALLVLGLCCNAAATSDLKTPPDITEPRSRRVDDVMPDTAHTLECTATGNPDPLYRWKLNGEEIQSSSIEVDPATGTLTISEFTDNEAGNYQCFAENMISTGVHAIAQSEVITLRKVELGASWEVAELILEAEEHHSVTLTCEDPPISVPDASFSWYLENGQTNEQGEVQVDDRIHVDAEGSLHFLDINKDDATDQDNSYKCGIYNAPLNIIKFGSSRKLIVNDGEATQIAPSLQYVTNPAEFLIGTDAKLECIFSGAPVPKVTWYDQKDSIIVNGGRYEYVEGTKGRTLIIKDIDLPDQQLFSCKATSDSGNSDAVVLLKVLSGPKWDRGLASQTVPVDKDAVFTCMAHDPQTGDSIVPKWYINTVQIPIQNSNVYQFSEKGSVLTVNKVKKSNIECFQCNVSNDISYEFGDGCLNVIDPIKFDVVPEAVQEVTKGDIVNLTVLGHTDPAYTLNYRWVYNNTDYPNADGSQQHPPHVMYNETTGEAWINTTDLTDEQYWAINGTYQRILYHRHENKTYTISVIVQDAPVVATVVAAGMDLWWIALIVALVILLIVIILIVIICNRKRQEGTYPLDKKERKNDIDPEKDLADSGFQDLSRAPGDDDFPTKKSGLNPNLDYGDDRDSGDDDDSLIEYGGADFDTSKFNEEGSFIGQYTSKNKTPEVKQSPMPLNHNSTESQI